MINSYLTPEQEDRLHQELMEDEVLLWAGQPTPIRTLRSGSMLSAAGAALFLLVIFSVFSVVFGRMFFFGMGMMGMMFGLVALIMLISIGAAILRPAWQWLNARRTLYAITDQRILILDGVLAQQVTSYGPDDVERVERRTYNRQGDGDLIFRYETRAHRVRSHQGYRRTQYREEPIGFFGIPDVRAVEQIMLDTFVADPSRRPKTKRKNEDFLAEEALDFEPDYGTTLEDLLPGIDPDDDRSAM